MHKYINYTHNDTLLLLLLLLLGDVVAQLAERRPRDPVDSMTRGSNPVRSTRTICEFFRVKQLC